MTKWHGTLDVEYEGSRGLSEAFEILNLFATSWRRSSPASGSKERDEVREVYET